MGRLNSYKSARSKTQSARLNKVEKLIVQRREQQRRGLAETRATASIAPVAMPEAAAGSTTPIVTRHCGAPKRAPLRANSPHETNHFFGRARDHRNHDDRQRDAARQCREMFIEAR